MTTPETPMYHLTVKWPGMPGHPEVMVNAYVPSAGELATAFEDIASIAAETYGLPRPRNAFEVAKEQAAAGPQPTPIRQAKEREAETSEAWDDNDAQSVARALGPHCPKHDTPMEKGQYNHRCTSHDPDEETGWCRMIQDKNGRIRRQATRAELDARRAAVAR